MPSSAFQPVSETDEFRQGDIIRPCDRTRSVAGLPLGSAGVIITADCDIANDKFGDYLSYLPIVPGEAYLDKFWAPLRLQEILADACKTAIDIIHGTEKRRDRELQRLTEDEFLEWLRDRGADAIVNAASVKREHARQSLSAQLLLIAAATADESDDDGLTNLFRLRSCRRLANYSKQAETVEVRKALSEVAKAMSFFLVPELPDVAAYGYVITLRDVRSIHINDAFITYKALPFSRRDDDCMYRIGRFSDRIRFAISQKFGSLFSRIGMTSDYENDCRAIPDFIAALVYPRHPKE
jgi:hypothetical protein